MRKPKLPTELFARRQPNGALDIQTVEQALIDLVAGKVKVARYVLVETHFAEPILDCSPPWLKITRRRTAA